MIFQAISIFISLFYKVLFVPRTEQIYNSGSVQFIKPVLKEALQKLEELSYNKKPSSTASRKMSCYQVKVFEADR